MSKRQASFLKGYAPSPLYSKEWDAFMKAIRSAPPDNEDLPRLVACDYLDEQGLEYLAERIRLEVRERTKQMTCYENYEGYFCAADRYCPNCKLLLDIGYPKGLLGIGPLVDKYQTSKGFITFVRVSIKQWMEIGPVLVRCPLSDIRHINLTGVEILSEAVGSQGFYFVDNGPFGVVPPEIIHILNSSKKGFAQSRQGMMNNLSDACIQYAWETKVFKLGNKWIRPAKTFKAR